MTNLIGIGHKKGVGKDTVAEIIQYLYYKYEERGGKTQYTFEEVRGFRNSMNTPWEIKKFADKLKDMVCLLIGCSREQLEDPEFKESPLGEEWKVVTVIPQDGPDKKFVSKQEAEDWIESLSDPLEILDDPYEEVLTPRKLMQRLGTGVCRRVHPSIWVNALFADYTTPTWQNTGESVAEEDVSIEPGEPPKWIISDVRFPDEAQAIKNRNGIVIRVDRPYLDTSDQHESETALDNYEDWDWVIQNDGTIEDLVVKVEEMLKQFKII